MSNKVHVKTGDEVVVINGKYRGKRGKCHSRSALPRVRLLSRA